MLLVESVELLPEGEDLRLERLLELMQRGLALLPQRGGVLRVLALEVAIALQKGVGARGGERVRGRILWR